MIRPTDADMLIVVDVQNDFCPGGALAIKGGDEVVPVINALMPRFAHVVATQDWHPAGHHSTISAHPGRTPFETVEASYGTQVIWPDHCIQGTDGASLHKDLKLDPIELVLRKGFRHHIDSYSAFVENDKVTSTGLAGYLLDRKVTRVFLTGLATDFCVAWSALDARRLGFEATVIEDACAAIDLDGSLQKAKAEMRAAGVNLINSGEIG